MLKRFTELFCPTVPCITTNAVCPHFPINYLMPLICFLQAREAQKPITDAGLMVLGSSTGMIKTARKLANDPKDRPTWQMMQNQSRAVSEAIKKLINSIR